MREREIEEAKAKIRGRKTAERPGSKVLGAFSKDSFCIQNCL